MPSFSKLTFYSMISHTRQQWYFTRSDPIQIRFRLLLNFSEALDGSRPLLPFYYLCSSPPFPSPAASFLLIPPPSPSPVPYTGPALVHSDIFLHKWIRFFHSGHQSLWNWRTAINISYVALKPLHLDAAFCFFVHIDSHLINAYWLSSKVGWWLILRICIPSSVASTIFPWF